MMERSTFQQAIIDESKTGKSLIIQAFAGSGKTTALKLISEANPNKKKLFLAFNRSVAYELGSKISAACKTVHSLGMSVLAPYGFNLRESKSSFIAKELGISRKRTLEFEEFWNVYRLTDSFPDSEVQEELIQDFCESDISEFYSYAAKCEELALKIFLEHSYADFTDMIYLSTKLIRKHQFNFNLVMLDEQQDSSPITLKLVRLLGDDSVQRIFVGDQFQNIYNTLNCTHGNNAKEAQKLWGCKEMSLPITYRCPGAIVEEAQKYVPDIIAFKQGGKVTRESFLPDEIPKGALILGAKYEFIMPEFIERRLAGERCILRGHNFIEESLKEAKKCLKSSQGYSFPTLMMMASEVIEEKASRVPFTLAGQARKQRFANMKNVLELLSDRFSSFDEASRFAGAITKETKPDYEFSSIHRAKGSESENVYFLEASQYEEAALSGDMDALRLAYTAVTRSMESLTLVG
jgi:superfamily I DNA/RNA helicase